MRKRLRNRGGGGAVTQCLPLPLGVLRALQSEHGLLDHHCNDTILNNVKKVMKVFILLHIYKYRQILYDKLNHINISVGFHDVLSPPPLTLCPSLVQAYCSHEEGPPPCCVHHPVSLLSFAPEVRPWTAHR